jgi:eukaryotic-like serine/threonine-protein kinase
VSLGPGSRLDAYEIVRPLGSGGMGEVWLATEVRLGRKVALKFLPADLTRDPTRIHRFEREARAASALNHPNVCTIYALGETDEHQYYIAMEYVEGETLGQRLVTSRLSIREALDIAIQVAAALSVAHATGIVHRDIKPENVMLRPDGVVKVLDFGLAKLAAAASAGTATRTELGVHTDAGKVVGTPAYMSPEQARGQQVDARTDIWSLGVMLYEMVAGRSPFTAPSRRTCSPLSSRTSLRHWLAFSPRPPTSCNGSSRRRCGRTAPSGIRAFRTYSSICKHFVTRCNRTHSPGAHPSRP